MHKGASDNQQSRAVRAVLNRRANDQLDPTVFAEKADRERTKAALIAQRGAITSRVSHLSALIERANGVRREGGCGVPAKTFGGWKIERAQLVQEQHDVEAKLSELKAFSDQTKESRLRDFNSVFVDLAKEMLAGEVFNRLVIASYHRLGTVPAAEKPDWAPPVSVRGTSR